LSPLKKEEIKVDFLQKERYTAAVDKVTHTLIRAILLVTVVSLVAAGTSAAILSLQTADAQTSGNFTADSQGLPPCPSIPGGTPYPCVDLPPGPPTQPPLKLPGWIPIPESNEEKFCVAVGFVSCAALQIACTGAGATTGVGTVPIAVGCSAAGTACRVLVFEVCDIVFPPPQPSEPNTQRSPPEQCDPYTQTCPCEPDEIFEWGECHDVTPVCEFRYGSDECFPVPSTICKSRAAHEPYNENEEPTCKKVWPPNPIDGDQ
jgi:hypothetical protein